MSTDVEKNFVCVRDGPFVKIETVVVGRNDTHTQWKDSTRLRVLMNYEHRNSHYKHSCQPYTHYLQTAFALSLICINKTEYGYSVSKILVKLTR